MLIFSPILGVIIKTKKILSSNFNMKDMGEASDILGMKIIREHNVLILS